MRSARLFVAVAAALLLAACSEFLTVEPRDELSRAALFSTVRGANAAVIGLYQRLGRSSYYQTRMPIYADVQGNMQALKGEITSNRTDPTLRRTEFIKLYSFTTTSLYDPSGFDGLYTDAYTILYQANDVIDGLRTLTEGSPEEIASLLAEARAIRALVHFDLVRLFAQAPNFSAGATHPGIVLVTEIPEIKDFPARASVAEVYAAIRADLEAAEAGIVDVESERSDAPYWLNKTVIRGMLARVASYQRDWEASFEWADRSLGERRYPLTDRANYVAQWVGGKLDETFWALDLQRLVESDSEPNFESPARVIGTGSETAFLQVNAQFVALLAESDIRRQLIGADTSANRLTRKWPFARNTIRNPILLRRSEVLLLRAEAAVELGRLDQALADLTTIARRADPAAPLPALDADALRDAIRLERRKELAFEGHHFFDLGRWGAPLLRDNCASFVSVCRLTYPDYRYILPIPFSALERNRILQQSDGY